MWFQYLLLALAIIGVSYGLSVWSFSAFLDDQGIYLGDDGQWYSYHKDNDAPEPVTFTYTLRNGVVEAFRVGDTMLPSWINEEEIDVIVSQPQHVLVKMEDGRTINVPQGDFVIRYPDGRFGALDAVTFEQELVKVRMEDSLQN